MKHVELFEFFVEGRNQDVSHVLLHITEPSTRDEFEKGYFFALIEVVNGIPEQIEHIQHIVDETEQAYYTTGDAHKTDEKGAFEFILESMNRYSADILDMQSEIHSLVGVVRDNHLSFSYHGLPCAMLFYSRGGQLEQMNLIQKQSAEEERQLFPSVLEGTLNDGDTIVLATPGVCEYFSFDRLQKILASRGLRQGIQHIQKVLHDLKDDVSFGGMSIRVIPPEEEPRTGKKPRSREGSAESLNRLIESERKTAETLSPPIFGNLAKKMVTHAADNPPIVEKGKRKKTETNYRPRSGKSNASIAEHLLIHIGRAVVYGIRWLFQTLKTIGIGIGRALVILVILATNKNNGRRQIIGSMYRKIDGAKEMIGTLPLVSKLLFAGAMLFALAFLGSIAYLRIQENVEAKKEQYSFTIQAVEDKTSAANAALIYNNDTKAFDLVKEAELLLETIDPEEHGDDYARLRAQIDDALEELQKIDTIEPEIIANLTSYDSADINKLAQIEDTLIAYADSRPTYFSINTNTHSIEEKIHDSRFVLAANTTPKENDVIVFINGTNGIVEYQKDSGGLLQKDISFPTENPDIVDGFVYNVRLYTLDRREEQIYKHTKTQTGYDKGTPWIANKTSSLADARALAIDSDIYVLKDSGDILLFDAGEERPFEAIDLDPPLEHPTDIWTYADVDALYILEPANRRLVVLNKDGTLIKQYTSSLWAEPQSMLIDSENNAAYILDRQRIYRLDL